ncbi:MAG: MFS transporter [Chloroflexota bacterium]|nr:MFS transporter [Chloroflexota bacterium]MDE2969956.1 MFS transporter [Chloroflexota bacterium]
METAERASAHSPRFFHGWWIVATSLVGAGVGMGIGGVGLGVFVEPMTGDLGWTRAEMGGVFIIRAIVMATLGPLMGPIVDRRMGAPVLFVGGAFIAGGSIMLLAAATEVWQFYVLFGLGWSIGQLAFAGNVLTGPIVAKWFIRKRGRAMGIYTMGIPIGSIIFVPLNAVLVTTFGWQASWVILGVATWLLTIPIAALTMRRQPEDMGLFPDGALTADEARLAGSPGAGRPGGVAAPVDFTLLQALRTPALYLLMLSFLMMGLAMGIFTIHQVPAITDKGFDLVVASIVSVTLSSCSFCVKPTVGFLSERFSPRYLCTLCMAVGAVGVVTLGLGDAMVFLFVFAACYGFGAGATPVFQNVIWADYFGRRYLGSIRGMIAPIAALGGGISPFIAGWMFDNTGSYDSILVTMGLGAFLAAAFMLMARPPRFRARA